jgi:hypothetical protein
MRRRARALACVALATHLAATQLACYAWVPAGADGDGVGTLAPGSRVALELNDAGRVALASTLAPSITRVEGTLVDASGDPLTLSLTGYAQIRGGFTQLTGDTVRVRREHVASLRRRELSRRRTWLAVGAGVVAVAAFVASRGLSGRGVPPEDRGGDGGPNQ